MTAAGDLIGSRWRVLGPLAKGGLGHVWLGADERTGRTVALKKCGLPKSLTAEKRSLVRLWVPREARAFARIQHPNVIRTLDVLLDGDAPWIVMEYVPSRSLLDVILADGPLPPARVAAIGLDLLAALTASWDADVLHLDVKPSNVLIAEDGRAVLTDFGPAGSKAGVAALAEAEVILGSPKYVAPERLFELITDERSDLWSLGATLYHAVEGRTPFTRETTDDALHAADAGRPDPAVLAGPLEPVLFGLMRRDPAERMAAAEVRRRLRRIAPASRRTRVLRTATAVAAAGAVAFAGVAFAGQSPSPAPSSSPTPPPSAPAQVAAPAPTLPPGFVWWTHQRADFRVAMPKTWKPAWKAGTLRCTSPTGHPTMTVSPWTDPGNVLAALTRAESEKPPPGYRRLRIQPLDDSPGAIWEYTFQDPQAGRMRAMRQVVKVGPSWYALDWRAPATDWATDLPTLLEVVPTLTVK
ncbi:serine/threonine protein kinase [Actinoplanes bogorensis]|uniref:non-specific serine/threonine protein kinase n=1 Tax=Paractinoplanes bogorensis TaxID=1610840 RepID=A0ABS5YP17_9ACTN|nr:serine/threonine-protein kinase [Actinoplanes bogorensis]MBU2664791.1 serine/threonine protein kinase [Actinoplanes bogorensis]